MTESERQASYLDLHDGSWIYGVPEWGSPETDATLSIVRDQWITPNVTPEKTVLEIGSGGGRWTRFLRAAKLIYSVDATPKSEQLIRGVFARMYEEITEERMAPMMDLLEASEQLTDAITQAMGILIEAYNELGKRKELAACRNLRFLIGDSSGQLPGIPSASVDYVFSYDTFVHFESEFDGYLGEIARVLKPGGVLHLHYAAEVGGVRGEEFRYREPAEVERQLRGLGLMPGRILTIPSGYGSILVECYRASMS